MSKLISKNCIVFDIDAAETVMVIVQEEKEEEIWSTVSDSWQILQG